jgi:O-antigen/teichoic acid export membrane protein
MLTKRVIAGVAGNMVFQVVNAVIQVIGIPLCLSYWGENYYGEWLLLFTIPGYFSVADFGLGTSSAAEMSMMEESGKTEEIQQMLRSTFWFVILWGLIPFGFLLLSNYFLPWSSWLNLKVISNSEFMATFPLLVLYIYLSLFLTVPINFYRVIKKYHVERYISAIHKCLEFGVLLILIIRGSGVFGVALGYLILRTCYFLYLITDLSIRTSLFKLLPVRIDFRGLRRIFKPGISSLFIYLGANILNQGLNTVIGINLGSAKLVMFNTIKTMVNMVKQVINIFNLSIYAEYSYAFGSGNKNLIFKIFRSGMLLNIVVGGLGCLGMLIFGNMMIDWWTKGMVNVDFTFFVLFLIYTFLGTISAVNFAVLSATNQFKNLGIIYLVLVAVLVGIDSIWIHQAGLVYISVLLILFEFILLSVSLKMVIEILGIGWKDMMKGLIGRRSEVFLK